MQLAFKTSMAWGFTMKGQTALSLCAGGGHLSSLVEKHLHRMVLSFVL